MPTAPSLFEQLNAALASGEAEDAIKGVKVRWENERRRRRKPSGETSRRLTTMMVIVPRVGRFVLPECRFLRALFRASRKIRVFSALWNG